MPSASEFAVRLRDEVATPLGIAARDVEWPDAADRSDVESSGLAELTGAPDGSPLSIPGRPVAVMRGALLVASAYLDTWLPGVELMSERARIVGLRRNAPWSTGGAFRALRTGDGWFGLSLARESDRDLLPALIEATVSEPWADVSRWASGRSTADVADRVELLGLPGAAIPLTPEPERRPPVLVTAGGARRRGRARPRVVDLTALWAGPLCARLLGTAAAEVVKVESTARPDGARLGNAAFFDRLHAGHEFVTLDFDRDRAHLADLVSSADVVLEGSRPRALRQLGIRAESYVERGAIWVGISAYGRGAVDEHRVGYGDDVAAGAGLTARLGATPVPVGDAIADPLAGAHAAAAAAIALAGERGALLDVSMHDIALRAAASTIVS